MIDRDDTRSAVDLTVPGEGGHLGLEYTVDIDRKLRSGEGLLEVSWGQATTWVAWQFWNHDTM